MADTDAGVEYAFPMKNDWKVPPKAGDSTIHSPRQGHFEGEMKKQLEDSSVKDAPFAMKNSPHKDSTGATARGKDVIGSEKPIYGGVGMVAPQGNGKVESKTDWHHG